MQSDAVVSLFSGAGGLSLGLSRAGLKPILAAEINSHAVATYQANLGDAILQADIARDAQELAAEARHRAAGRDILAVIGGPPCQGFSSAGARAKDDPRNHLVWAYLAVVEALRPRWFLFENVEGLLTAAGGEALLAICQAFTRLGYSFRVDKVNLARWGVPQARKRVLIVGNRLGLPFTLPTATHGFEGLRHRGQGIERVSVVDTLAGLPETAAQGMDDLVRYATDAPGNAYEAQMRDGGRGCTAHVTAGYARDLARIRLLQPGQGLRSLPEDMWPARYRERAFRRVRDGTPSASRGGAPAGLRRLREDHASLTITGAAPRELIHPLYDRPLSLRECARLQSFPDTYQFSGGLGAVAQQIANAVPPLAAEVLARWLVDQEQRIRSGELAGSGSHPPGLLGFHLTDGSGMSPCLRRMETALMR